MVRILPALLGGDPVRPQGPPELAAAGRSPSFAALAAAWRGRLSGTLPGRATSSAWNNAWPRTHGVAFALTCGQRHLRRRNWPLRALKVGPGGPRWPWAAYDYPGKLS